MSVIDMRMASVTQAYAAMGGKWGASNPAAFADWTADFTALNGRWAQARANAASAIANPAFGAFQAQSVYDGMLKAIRQCAPPDGCPLTKGDLDDLSARLAAAAGASVEPVGPLPQPTSDNAAMAFFKTTAPADIVAQLKGDEAPKLPVVAGWLNFVKWVTDHKVLLLAGGGLIVGGVVLAYVAPTLGLALKGVKGVAALAA